MLSKSKKRAIVTLMLSLCLIVSFTIPAFAASKKGLSKVWAGLPLIGHIYVCIPWTATYSGSGSTTKLTRVKTGESYTSAGVALISYSHYDSWAKITGKRSFEVYARGHCDFAYKGCPISLGLQTFLAYESI